MVAVEPGKFCRSEVPQPWAGPPPQLCKVGRSDAQRGSLGPNEPSASSSSFFSFFLVNSIIIHSGNCPEVSRQNRGVNAPGTPWQGILSWGRSSDQQGKSALGLLLRLDGLLKLWYFCLALDKDTILPHSPSHPDSSHFN